jgi:hypothetical protein
VIIGLSTSLFVGSAMALGRLRSVLARSARGLGIHGLSSMLLHCF